MYSPYISACARSPPIFSTHFACLLERMNESMAELKDQYGNPIRLTDEYGSPMYVTRAVPSSTTFPSQVSSGSTTLPPHISSVGEGGGVGDSNLMSGPGTGVISGSEVSRLHDTGELVSTSSSSSSEDDGLGRRRKRGLRQKIKEKLGGGGEHEDPAANGMMYGEHDTEKKSMMEKIKDRLPGHHHAH